MFNTEFLLTSLVVVLIPGTGVIYTVSTGLFKGWRASIAAATGCTAGIIPHLTGSILGLSTILHMSSVAFQLVKYVGAAYLLYLAWAMWRETGAINFDPTQSNHTNNMKQIALRGFLLNILNPKLSIFFLAFLPLFVSADSGAPVLQLIWLSLAFMGMTLIVFIIYGISANYLRNHFFLSPKRLRWVQRSFAAIFALLGAKLAFAK